MLSETLTDNLEILLQVVGHFLTLAQESLTVVGAVVFGLLVLTGFGFLLGLFTMHIMRRIK